MDQSHLIKRTTGAHSAADRPKDTRSHPPQPGRPAALRRCLTITEQSPRLVACDQMQSMLFRKLPLDVRYLIYKEVLCGWIFKIKRSGPEPLSSWHLTRPRLEWKAKMTASYPDGQTTVWHGIKQSGLACKRHLLPLLETCRRMYV